MMKWYLRNRCVLPKARFCAALFFTCILASSFARTAEPAPSVTPASQAECLRDPECHRHYRTARKASDAGQYTAALAEYQLAYTERQVPLLLFNIARTLHKMKRYQEAIAYYQKYLDSPSETTEELLKTAAQYKTQAEKESADSQPPPLNAGIAGTSAASISGSAGMTANSSLPKPIGEPRRASRPKWRIAVGVTILAVGVGLLGVGAAALSVNGRCQTPGTMGQCTLNMDAGSQPTLPRTVEVYDTTALGASLLAVGGLLTAAGVVTIALPGKRIDTQAAATLFPSPGVYALTVNF
jgi:hypothetical protein